MMKKITIVMTAVMLLMACHTDKTKEYADELLQTASSQFEQKHYDAALQTIDSLRRTYPKAIDARKQALVLQQNIELTRAQEELAVIDQALQKAKADYERMKRQSEAHHKAGTATADELTRTTLMRMHRDSLQVQFDVQCAKIKYIHKRQKQVE